MTEMCLANIDAAGKRRRLVIGVAVLGGTIAEAKIGGEALGAWLALAPLPLAFGRLCVVQSVENT